MNIANFLERKCKKGDLSSSSNGREDPKQPCKEICKEALSNQKKILNVF